MSNLSLQFSELYTKISEYLGLTSYGTAPTGTDLTRCKDIAYRGYRRFLYPIDSAARKIYLWSFLRKEAALTTVNSKWKYELPPDFVSLAVGFKFNNAENYPPLELKPESFLANLRSMSVATAIPRYCSIVNGKFDKETGLNKELRMFPAPNAALTYYYTYIFIPDKPDTSTDLLVGGAIAAETILQCCIAAAELQEKPEQLQAGQAGYQETKAQQMLQSLIEIDRQSQQVLEPDISVEQLLSVMPQQSPAGVT